MNTSEKKDLARSLFVRTNMIQKAIAKEVGVTDKTLRKWIKDGNWQLEKDARSVTKSELIHDEYMQLKAINDKIRDEHGGVPPKDLADAKATCRKNIEALEDEPLFVQVEVFEQFMGWIGKNHPKELQTISKLSFDYLREKNEKR